MLFCFLCGIGLFSVLYGSRFTDQDIFDHWGTVVRLIVRKHRFPNYLDVYLPHKTYPVGSVCWIYYWMVISGIRSEYFQMFAQNFLILGMMVSFFPLVKNVTGKLLTVVVSVMLLCANRELFSLQVDNILPVTALSAICFFVYYQEKIGEKYLWLSIWMIFLVSVKNSGLLFAFFILLPVVHRIGWKKAGMLAGIPGTAFLIWQKHAAYVFTDAAKAKHTPSLVNYRAVLSEKSREDIIVISRKVLDRELSYHNNFVYLLILAILLFTVCHLLYSEKKGLIRSMSIYSILCYCVHQAGLWVIYLISMPLREALNMAHYMRYRQTVVVFSAGMLLIAVLVMLEKKSSSVILKNAVAAVVCGLFFWGIKPNYHYLARQNPSSLRNRIYYEDVLSQSSVEENSRINVFTAEKEDPHNYFNALTRYYFAPAKVKHSTPTDTSSLQNYDYIFVMTEDDDARAYIRENAISEDVTVIMR